MNCESNKIQECSITITLLQDQVQIIRVIQIKIQIQNQQLNKDMRVFICIIGLLLVALQAQEVLVQELPIGQYRGIRKQSKDVPRFYLCGAGIWRLQIIHHPPQMICTRSRPRGPVTCERTPPVLILAKTWGIRFTYCHFQNWHNTMTREERNGSQEKIEMQMCPENMYVYGFRTKLTDRDGMAGLILLCRSMKNSLETKAVLVFDGQGSWRDPVSSGNFAVGFNAKITNGHIYGLAMQMAAVPYIFAFTFNYQFPKDFNTVPSQIENIIVQNYGLTAITKQISMSRQKQFARIWENSKGQLNGTFVSDMFSQSLTTKSKIGIPFLVSIKEASTEKSELTQGSREERVETFKFGTIETFKVGQRQKDVVTVPPCTKYTIRQIVEYTDADVPYTLQIGYTNGQAMQYETINGFYRGVAVGEVKTTVRYEDICSRTK